MALVRVMLWRGYANHSSDFWKQVGARSDDGAKIAEAG